MSGCFDSEPKNKCQCADLLELMINRMKIIDDKVDGIIKDLESDVPIDDELQRCIDNIKERLRDIENEIF